MRNPWGICGSPRNLVGSFGTTATKKNITFPGNLEVGEICSKFHPFDIDFDMISIVILINVTSIIVIILYMIKLTQDPQIISGFTISPRILQRSSSSVDGRAPWISNMIQWDLLFRKVDRTTEKVSGKLSSKLTWQWGKSPFLSIGNKSISGHLRFRGIVNHGKSSHPKKV